jgi:exodeoxyribonuclease VII large subunit
MQPPRGVITVAELGRRMRRVVEVASTADWVEGEVSGVRRVSSGHCYFTLKDAREEAVVDCVMYRSALLRAGRHLSEGARVQMLGRATFWAPRGRLQFIADALRPVGRGELLEALERLKTRLFEEGLFASERKRPLPGFVRVIGVVTSGHGAAWHDIRVVALRRGAVKLVLSPALVQGEGAAESIRAALDKLERYPGLDAIIIGRGGGSLEDLMAFNDESVVRRVAQCGVPTVSAVGHEIDTTLCDLVADARAATPSEAAERLVSDARVRLRELAQWVKRLRRAARERLREDRSLLDGCRSKLADPRYLVAEKQLSLDDLSFRLERRLRHRISLAVASRSRLEQRLHGRHPRAIVQRSKGELAPFELRLRHALRERLARLRERAQGENSRLLDLSPLAVLGRGYAIALDHQGKAVTDAGSLSVDERLSVRFHRGAAEVGVVAVRAETSAEQEVETRQ